MVQTLTVHSCTNKRNVAMFFFASFTYIGMHIFKLATMELWIWTSTSIQFCQWDLLHTSTHKSHHTTPFLKDEITKLQHNNFVMCNLKTQDQITKLQLKKCCVQLENSRSFIMHIHVSFVVCLNMLYAQVWSTVCHGVKQGIQWQHEVGGTGPTTWYGCFKAEANYAHEGEDVEGDRTFIGNRWWCT
jgi:hypothetical protein